MSDQQRMGFAPVSGLRCLALVLLCFALFVGCLSAQQGAVVPNLVKFGGSISSASATSEGVIFALYKDQTGGAPLWQEVQTVSVDAAGHYTVLLGSASTNGIPLDLFGSGEARWLGVQVQGQAEQSRVLLVSVPYAMKAADAQTLGGLPASAFLRADGSSSTTYVNTAAVTSAAASIAAVPAVTTSDTVLPGFLPMFDSTGTSTGVTDSNLFQAANGNLGLGTTNPQFNLHFVSTVDPAAVTVDGYGNTGVNFIGRRAGGTPSAPTAVTAGSNLLTMQGRGYGLTGFAQGSRANIKFFAAETWTDSAQGTYITLATTPVGTTSAADRLRITDAGNVGIGTTTPGARLEVNGGIKMTAASGGAITFADGTMQATAAAGGGGVTITSPDSSLTVAGTATAPTLAVNTTNIQKRVASACSSGSAIASISATGTVSCQTVSGGGAVSLPVNWTSSPNPPTTVPGVLNVTNTATGPAEPTSNPSPSFFNSVPTAVLGKATGSQITSGVSGIGTGPESIGVFAYTPDGSTTGTGSHVAALIAWSGVTGYTPSGTKGDYPKAIMAQLSNQTGGAVISAEANATTAPTCAPSSTNCKQITGVDAKMDASSGQTIAFNANLNSPLATGLQLNFNSPLTAGTNTTPGGSIISANVNCGGTGPCTYFQVDGGGNVNTSGGVNANGQINANGGLNVGSGLSAPGGTVFINGNLQVSGNLGKSSGTFKIDHPLDPANKYLYHSFVESPDMMNIYNGVIVLDRRGKAVVQLPDYFQALNQDFRYQLTAIGAPGPNLFVATEIKGNKFAIAGGKPGAKVSWQVTGIRHDAYAEAHRVVVEEDKGKERGTYLHPELFNQQPVVAKK